MYNCWGFTFDPRQCWISTGQDVQNILDDNGTPVADGSIEPGDIVCYRYNGGITHTGRVWEVDENGHATVVRSKWGNLGEYLHHPVNVPITYGRDISYWRCTHLQGRARLFLKDNDHDDSYQYSSIPFWESPDIWVDRDLDGAPEDSPIAGRTNHLYAIVRNVGTVSITNTEVRFYWADPSGGIPPSDWNLIGTYNIPDLDAQSSIKAGPVPWIPEEEPRHQCLLVIANGGDSVAVSGDPDPIVYPFNVRWENSITMKNIFITTIEPPRPVIVSFFAQPRPFWYSRQLPEYIDLDIELIYDTTVDFEKVKDYAIYLKAIKRLSVPLVKYQIQKKFIESGINLELEGPEKLSFKKYDSKSVFKRTFKQIELKPEEKTKFNIRIEVPEDIRSDSKFTLNIVQKANGIITGGITYHINIAK